MMAWRHLQSITSGVIIILKPLKIPLKNGNKVRQNDDLWRIYEDDDDDTSSFFLNEDDDDARRQWK